MTAANDAPLRGVSEIVSGFIGAGGQRALADVYRAVADAGHGDGKEVRHRVRGAIHAMHKAGRIRRVSAGVWEAAA